MNLTKILIAHVNKWVALSPDRKRVLASEKDLKSLDTKIKKSGYKDVIYHFVMPFDRTFAP